jgi:hypothetical protein
MKTQSYVFFFALQRNYKKQAIFAKSIKQE